MPRREWPYGKPTPQSAWFNGGQQTFEITFNMPLQSADLVPGSFTFSEGDDRYVATVANSREKVVFGHTEHYDTNPEDHCVSWYGDPADILSKRGAPADPIVCFPLT